MPSQRKDGTAIGAVIDDIRRATRGRHMRWVMIDEVARRRSQCCDPQAEVKCLLVAEGSPPHSVCLKAAGGFGS